MPGELKPGEQTGEQAGELKPGLRFELSYRVPPDKTVPHLYPDAADFQEMPQVFATGFMVGLIEWACLLAVKPHLDWPRQMTVGTHVDLSHVAATPPGLTVLVEATLTEVQGRKLGFAVRATDGVDLISEGRHERFIIDAESFNRKAREKAQQAAG